MLLWDELPGDLSAIYVAGWFWNNGEPGLIYDAPPHFFGGTPPQWISRVNEIGGQEATVFPYVYPPLWAALAGPLTGWMDAFWFSRTVYVFHISLLVACVFISARFARPRLMPYWTWAALAVIALVLSTPAKSALDQNQPTIAMMFLLLFGLDRLVQGKDRAAGICLAIAAALKITPVLFVLILLVERRFRAVAAFVVTGGLLGGLSLLLCGTEAHWQFRDAVQLVSDNGLISAVNLSLRTAFYGVAAIVGAVPAFDIESRNSAIENLPAWIDITLPLVGALIIGGWLFALRKLDDPARLTLAWLTFALVIPLFGPLGWQHYYLLPLFLLPSLVSRLPKGLRSLAVAAALISSALVTLLLTALMPWPTMGYVWIATGGWLVLLGLIPFARGDQSDGQNGLTTLPE
ncbi:glycosyltransferase family 87 protein [Frigidibacter sp. RF13]|nr:glycosyltransferase family 87 protein [Frigidibacter sp. RF13]